MPKIFFNFQELMSNILRAQFLTSTLIPKAQVFHSKNLSLSKIPSPKISNFSGIYSYFS